MPTREQVISLLDGGHSYESAGRALKLSPALVYMIATGAAADGSERSGTQQLLGVPAVNPTRKPEVIDWVRRRAAIDLTPRP
jgi:hypothetical protein